MELAVCPGTPITFTRYHATERTHVGLAIHGMRLQELGIPANGN
jgi:hypothetical protein